MENHYRYYQFYANMLVALAIAYPTWRISTCSGLFQPVDLAFLLVEGVFLAASRDALRRYYQRSATLLGTHERQCDHDERSRQRRRGRRPAAQHAGDQARDTATQPPDREAGRDPERE